MAASRLIVTGHNNVIPYLLTTQSCTLCWTGSSTPLTEATNRFFFSVFFFPWREQARLESLSRAIASLDVASSWRLVSVSPHAGHLHLLFLWTLLEQSSAGPPSPAASSSGCHIRSASNSAPSLLPSCTHADRPGAAPRWPQLGTGQGDDE